jgi:hypothetical protein
MPFVIAEDAALALKDLIGALPDLLGPIVVHHRSSLRVTRTQDRAERSTSFSK